MNIITLKSLHFLIFSISISNITNPNLNLSIIQAPNLAKKVRRTQSSNPHFFFDISEHLKPPLVLILRTESAKKTYLPLSVTHCSRVFVHVRPIGWRLITAGV